MACHCFLHKLLRPNTNDLIISSPSIFIFYYLSLLCIVLGTNGTTHCFSYICCAFPTQHLHSSSLPPAMHFFRTFGPKSCAPHSPLQCHFLQSFSPGSLSSSFFASYICNFFITPVLCILIHFFKFAALTSLSSLRIP